MFAIFKSGGKQYKVSAGNTLRLESLQAEVGSKIVFDKVLAIGNESDLKIGTPFVEGSKINATVLSVGREKKITVIKFRRRKDSRLKQGHRQYYTEVKIDDLGEGSVKKTKTAKPQEDTKIKKPSTKEIEKNGTKKTVTKKTSTKKTTLKE